MSASSPQYHHPQQREQDTKQAKPPASLLSLCTEIQAAILRLLHDEDVKSVARVCKGLQDEAEKLIWSDCLMAGCRPVLVLGDGKSGDTKSIEERIKRIELSLEGMREDGEEVAGNRNEASTEEGRKLALTRTSSAAPGPQERNSHQWENIEIAFASRPQRVTWVRAVEVSVLIGLSDRWMRILQYIWPYITKLVVNHSNHQSQQHVIDIDDYGRAEREFIRRIGMFQISYRLVDLHLCLADHLVQAVITFEPLVPNVTSLTLEDICGLMHRDISAENRANWLGMVNLRSLLIRDASAGLLSALAGFIRSSRNMFDICLLGKTAAGYPHDSFVKDKRLKSFVEAVASLARLHTLRWLSDDDKPTGKMLNCFPIKSLISLAVVQYSEPLGQEYEATIETAVIPESDTIEQIDIQSETTGTLHYEFSNQQASLSLWTGISDTVIGELRLAPKLVFVNFGELDMHVASDWCHRLISGTTIRSWSNNELDALYHCQRMILFGLPEKIFGEGMVSSRVCDGKDHAIQNMTWYNGIQLPEIVFDIALAVSGVRPDELEGGRGMSLEETSWAMLRDYKRAEEKGEGDVFLVELRQMHEAEV